MLKSILKPEHAVAVGIGIGAVDLLIFERLTPGVADIRTAHPKNADVETTRRQAVIYCVGVNGLVSLMTRDWNVFLIGGIVTISLSYLIAHANEVNPATGKMAGSVQGSLAPDMEGFALEDYSMQQPDAA
jgi:hypothetical protein